VANGERWEEEGGGKKAGGECKQQKVRTSQAGHASAASISSRRPDMRAGVRQGEEERDRTSGGGRGNADAGICGPPNRATFGLFR